MRDQSTSYFTFRADENRFALPVDAVLKVIHAVYVTPVPDSPPEMEGVFSFHQKLIPVVNLRRRFKSSDRKMGVDDVFILLRLGDGLLIALVADEAEGVLAHVALKDASETAEKKPTGSTHALHQRARVMRDDAGILLLYRPEQLLTDELKAWIDGLIEEDEILKGSH